MEYEAPPNIIVGDDSQEVAPVMNDEAPQGTGEGEDNVQEDEEYPLDRREAGGFRDRIARNILQPKGREIKS
jgi:hypothetical protein